MPALIWNRINAVPPMRAGFLSRSLEYPQLETSKQKSSSTTTAPGPCQSFYPPRETLIFAQDLQTIFAGAQATTFSTVHDAPEWAKPTIASTNPGASKR